MNKVFGIGLSRTGTQSLAAALGMLGLRAVHYPRILWFRWGRASIDYSIIDSADAFTDIPIAAHYRELDTKYPGSKFIYTVRDRASWLHSIEQHLARKRMPPVFPRHEMVEERIQRNPALARILLPVASFRRSLILRGSLTKSLTIERPYLRLKLFGSLVFDRMRFLNAYERHEREVQSYFSRREGDLLTLNVSASDAWLRLCSFLGKPIHNGSFPHVDEAGKASRMQVPSRPWREKLASNGPART